uniref:Uncharacterized protein n=1 Tax=Anguilla anguilla TaxID=7936 RepID=A0A0E9XQB3_ANGAN
MTDGDGTKIIFNRPPHFSNVPTLSSSLFHGSQKLLH